jgi:hypothetical protein
MILDCCFSGRVVSDSMAGSATELVSQMEVDGTYVLTSAQRDQVALILPGEEHTAFTGRLLRLLKDGVPGGPEFLTIDDLYRHLLVRMKAEGLSEPQKRATRTADLLALSVNRAFAGTAGHDLRQRRAAAVEQGERGDWEQAAASLRGVLEDQTRILGSDNQDTLRTRLESAALLRKLLAEQTLVLGADHEDTLRTRQYLAVNLGEAGYRDEAVAILRVLLPDRRRLLGSDDTQTLRTAHMLARYLALTNVTGEASALLKEVVAVRERVLGGDHPHTNRARRDLADLLNEKPEDTNV